MGFMHDWLIEKDLSLLLLKNADLFRLILLPQVKQIREKEKELTVKENRVKNGFLTSKS
jgi:hypothetical protein